MYFFLYHIRFLSTETMICCCLAYNKWKWVWAHSCFNWYWISAWLLELFLLNVAECGSSSEPANCLCKFVIVGFVLGPLNLTLGDAFSCMEITNLSIMKGKGKHNSWHDVRQITTRELAWSVGSIFTCPLLKTINLLESSLMSILYFFHVLKWSGISRGVLIFFSCMSISCKIQKIA